MEEKPKYNLTSWEKNQNQKLKHLDMCNQTKV